MAFRPKASADRTQDLAQRRAAEQGVLMREVDDAVRQDQYANAAKSFAIPLVAAVIVVLLAFGGWLWWQSSREAQLEETSEQLVLAMDQLRAGNSQVALDQLATVAEDGSDGQEAAATMLRAGILLEQGSRDEAVQLFEAVVADTDAPEEYRNLAAIRAASAGFESMEPQEVINRLKPLATPGNPWFGSAGELVAMAYLQQGQEDLAGPLLAAIAQEEDVPQSLRSRTRQLAGVLGYDAIEDVDQTLQELSSASGVAGPEVAPAQ